MQPYLVPGDSRQPGGRAASGPGGLAFDLAHLQFFGSIVLHVAAPGRWAEARWNFPELFLSLCSPPRLWGTDLSLQGGHTARVGF